MSNPIDVGSVLGGRYKVTATVLASHDHDLVLDGVDQVLNRPVSILVAGPRTPNRLPRAPAKWPRANVPGNVQVLDLGVTEAPRTSSPTTRPQLICWTSWWPPTRPTWSRSSPIRWAAKFSARRARTNRNRMTRKKTSRPATSVTPKPTPARWMLTGRPLRCRPSPPSAPGTGPAPAGAPGRRLRATGAAGAALQVPPPPWAAPLGRAPASPTADQTHGPPARVLLPEPPAKPPLPAADSRAAVHWGGQPKVSLWSDDDFAQAEDQDDSATTKPVRTRPGQQEATPSCTRAAALLPLAGQAFAGRG